MLLNNSAITIIESPPDIRSSSISWVCSPSDFVPASWSVF